MCSRKLPSVLCTARSAAQVMKSWATPPPSKSTRRLSVSGHGRSGWARVSENHVAVFIGRAMR